MKVRWIPFSPTRPRRLTSRGTRRGGTTLIEVLAGLVVLGTVLAAVVIARGRFMRQWADADRKLRVTHATDAMLEDWMADPTHRVPLRSEGTLPGVADCDWQTSVSNDAESAKLDAMIVRLQVFDRRADYGSRPAGVPVTVVDVLVHRLPKTTR